MHCAFFRNLLYDRSVHQCTRFPCRSYCPPAKANATSKSPKRPRCPAWLPHPILTSKQDIGGTLTPVIIAMGQLVPNDGANPTIVQ